MMDIDVAEAIDDEAVPVIFQLPGAATYDPRGNAVKEDSGEQTGWAAIQPASGRMLQDLPEGLRSEVSMVGWSRTMVAVKWEIIYGAEKYRVVHVWPRPSDGFSKFAMKRVE